MRVGKLLAERRLHRKWCFKFVSSCFKFVVEVFGVEVVTLGLTKQATQGGLKMRGNAYPFDAG